MLNVLGKSESRNGYKVGLAPKNIPLRSRLAVMWTVLQDRVTQGPKVQAFENRFQMYLGVGGNTRCTMVNSGSSANDLMARLLRHWRPQQSDRTWEVVMPALTWSTSVAPFIREGFRPVFVDIGPDYTMDTVQVQDAINPNTAAVLAVHLLGNPCDMTTLYELCDEYDVILLEDCCEALGAMWKDKMVGSWGQAASFSFYYSHHMTTVEGGMLVHPRATVQPRAWREHGWSREYPTAHRESLSQKYPDLDPRFTFAELGHNLRSNDVHATLGLSMLDKVDTWITHRQRIADMYDDVVADNPRTLSKYAVPSPMSYPYDGTPWLEDVQLRNVLTGFENQGVETRPVMTGNITDHPWTEKYQGVYRVHDTLTRTNQVQNQHFLLPCHRDVSKRDVEYVRDVRDNVISWRK